MPWSVAAQAIADWVASPMAAGRPSATAQGAALLRAAHQLVDRPRVLDDPLALKVIGSEAELALREAPERAHARRSLRAFVALRSSTSQSLHWWTR